MGGYIITMSPEPQTPIWRRFLQRKRRLAKSSLISLPEIPVEFPPNTLYSEPLANESTDLLPEITSATEPSMQLSLELSLDDPTDRIPAITPVLEPSPQPAFEPSTNDPIDLLPAITPIPEPLPQLSFEP